MSISIDHPPSALQISVGGRDHWLHPSSIDHAQPMLEAVQSSLPELRAFMPWAHLPQTLEGQRARLAELERGYATGGDQVFHMRDERGGPILGCIGLHHRSLNPRAFGIGFWVRTSSAGRGLATLWSRCLTVLCFERYGYDRVQCCHHEANLASARVIEKVGFVQEGRLRRYSDTPTPEMVAAGMKEGLYTVIYGLCPEHRSELPWYEEIARTLVLHAEDGTVHPARPPRR